MPQFENQISLELKKDLNQIFNFSHSFRPIYIVSRIFGQMPFLITTNHMNGDIHDTRVTWFDLVWFTITSSIYIYSTIYTPKLIYATLQQNFSSISAFGAVIIFASVLFLGVYSILFDMCCRMKIVDILNKFIIFDKKVKDQIYFNHKLIWYILWNWFNKMQNKITDSTYGHPIRLYET